MAAIIASAPRSLLRRLPAAFGAAPLAAAAPRLPPGRALSSAPPAAPAAPASAKKIVRFQDEAGEGHFGVFTAVTVNGQVVQGLLDSGATEHAMDAGLARTLGIRATGRRVNTLGIGGVSRGFYSDLVDLLIGGRMFARSTVAILDLSDLSNRLGQPVQMLLGRPLFNAMTVEMDFRLRTARLWERLRFTEPTDATAVKLSGIMGLMTAPVTLPGGMPAADFERLAKMVFIRMQAANDAANLDDLRKFTTPELFASLRLDLQERGAAKQQTDVVQIDAQVVEAVQEKGQDIVTVRFSGLIREAAEAGAEPFNELWHLVRPADGAGEWAIAGITPVQ